MATEQTASADAIVVSTEEEAQELVGMVADHVTVYSQDTHNQSKFHLHDEQGRVLTQVNTGSSVDWDRLLDLRE